MVSRVTITEHDLGLVRSRLMRQPRVNLVAPADWRGWHAAVVPGYLWPPYADYHVAFWEWLWSIAPGEAAPPFVAIWPRGFAKSTSVEVGGAAVAARGTRKYGLYVCATQDQADTHVANVAGILESAAFAKHYPAASRRRLGKYGNSQGWRRNRLRAESGFTLDAIGLDTAARGAKVDEARPDFLIFDDIDELLDSPGTVAKKIAVITQSILPARAEHAVTLVAQNLIHGDGVVAQLADGRADFLASRIVSGPHPAIAGLVTEQRDGKYVITGGAPTWEAKPLASLQAELDEIGLTAFLREKQHDVEQVEGSMFQHLVFRRCAWADVPSLQRITVAIDPAVTDTDKSDAHGIQASGLASDGTIYCLYSWERRTSPDDVMRRAILKAIELGADTVLVETDQGGDTWQTVFDAVWDHLLRDETVPQIVWHTRRPVFRQDKASAGHGSKAMRTAKYLAAYERGEVVHVIGTHDALESALRRYLIRKPFDLVDAAFWAWHDLTAHTVPSLAPSVASQRSVWS
jgi:hypothetical protein